MCVEVEGLQFEISHKKSALKRGREVVVFSDGLPHTRTHSFLDNSHVFGEEEGDEKQ